MKMKKNGEIYEMLFEYFDFYKKTWHAIPNDIIDIRKKSGIYLLDSCGQWFDNGSNTASQIKGVQAKIKRKIQ